MGLNAKTQAGGAGKDFEKLTAGVYAARLVQVVDLGRQAQRPYKGQPKDPAYEIALTYELLDAFMKDEDGQPDPAKPRWITETMRFYNLEAEKAKSTERYMALDPTVACDGDWDRLLNTPCMVTIVLNENNATKKIYENIEAIAPMRAEQVAIAVPLVNPAKFFDLDKPSVEDFLALPKFLQKRIQAGLDYPGSEMETLLVAAGEAEPAKEVGDESEEAKVENPY